MTWHVEFHPAFETEFLALAAPVRIEMAAQLVLLQTIGPTLGRPRVDTLKGSEIPNLKELRFDADNGVWRVLFAFDKRRVAVLLVAGDKSGVAQTRFYKMLIKTAEARWKTKGA